MANPPTRMVTSMSMGGGGGAPAQAPPDLPSLLLNSRICYLGMPVRARAERSRHLVCTRGVGESGGRPPSPPSATHAAARHPRSLAVA